MIKDMTADELTLHMIRLRSRGVSPSDVGRSIGKSSQFVSTATNRVRRADQAESGDPLAEVNAGYW